MIFFVWFYIFQYQIILIQGELKLAKKNLSMAQIDDLMKQIDENDDGKLTYQEMLKLVNSSKKKKE